jgi:death on curing protein
MLHAETLRLFGGRPGIRDAGLLESAIAHVRTLHGYDPEASLFALAAAYAHRLARNHPFVDGNKRVALLSARAFLFRNGYRLDPPEADTVVMMTEVAAGTVGEVDLVAWLERNA